MTALLTSYTTYADIRAALGVSEDEVEDSTLALSLYADYLETELEDIDLTLPATFVTVKAIVSPTEAQTRFLQSVRLFTTFAVAKQLSAALPLFAAKQVSDSKATMQRFDNPYKDTVASVNQQYDKMRKRLAVALVALGTTAGTTTTQVFVSAVSPSYDRVTGS